MAEDSSLGDVIRMARTAKGLSLRGLADVLAIAPSYLSDIENDRRVPAEDILIRIADVLELEIDQLMVLAGRFGAETERYLKKQPDAVLLFRRISQANLNADDLRELADEISQREARPKEQ